MSAKHQRRPMCPASSTAKSYKREFHDPQVELVKLQTTGTKLNPSPLPRELRTTGV